LVIGSGQGTLPALDEILWWLGDQNEAGLWLCYGCVGRAKFKPITGLCLRIAYSIVTSKADYTEKKYCHYENSHMPASRSHIKALWDTK
jgi:hypothetical protein